MRVRECEYARVRMRLCYVLCVSRRPLVGVRVNIGMSVCACVCMGERTCMRESQAIGEYGYACVCLCLCVCVCVCERVLYGSRRPSVSMRVSM